MSTPCLLGMPPEIRNAIFELVLIRRKSLSIGRNSNHDPQGKYLGLKILLQQPPLAQVNKQTRSEALPVFHGKNTFIIQESRFSTSSDRQKCYRLFANETALKYLKKLSYGFESNRYVVDPEPGWIDMALNEAKELEVTVRGPVSETCVCSTMAKLRSLVAGFDPTPATSAEGALEVPGRKLAELAPRVVPELQETLENHRMWSEYGLSPLLLCSECGKVNWTALLKAREAASDKKVRIRRRSRVA
ncbi:hypothetical protein LTR17_006951 [Elasticomyces elasticus]|nr:hypothetical protein LTR17_006951 [Elasticomyces elasticus]